MTDTPTVTPTATPSDAIRCTLHALHLHPVKSCAGLAVPSVLLAATGLAMDRQWMVVDPQGNMLTQRTEPRMALIRPTLAGDHLVLRAPGMLALHVLLRGYGAPTRVRIWDDAVRAGDLGDTAAQWLCDFLKRPLRLVRFASDEDRRCDAAWAGTLDTGPAFADAYPLLVTSTAALDDLNARLAARGCAPVTMSRFRPNLVLTGLQPGDDDHLDEIDIATDGGLVTLRLVKPCTRCTIPDVDPDTGVSGNEPGATLAGYRRDPRMNGAVTFGVHAVVVRGAGSTLRVGQPARARWNFG